ncbi:hypothetical protein ACFLYS_02115 [Chloroflexota bacterium]
MTKLLVKNLKSATTVMAVGLAFCLILGIALITGCQSGVVTAQEIAANSPEVQDALGGEVKVIGAEIGDGKALVICTDTEGNSYVVAEIDLKDKGVTKVSYPAVGEPYLPNPQMESEVLQTITNKLSYTSGEEVTIEMANISTETISGGGVYFSVYSLDGQLIAGNGLFLAFEWEPSEGFSSFTWNQTNENGEQVEPGTYVILGKAGDYSDAILISID